jgi:TM2 domain-containing membrane protein YozV
MKSKFVAYLLWLISFFGWFGLHRFYLGKKVTGCIWIFTFGLVGIGAIYDFFTLGTQVETYNYVHSNGINITVNMPR